MAITTQAAANSSIKPPYNLRKAGTQGEAVGILYSHFYNAGEPAAAAAPTPGLAGAALTSYAGQIPFNNPVSGNTYLYDFTVYSSGLNPNILPTFFLLDRLWHNSGFTITQTTAQTVDSVTWPARDFSASTDGVDVQVAIEVSTPTGAHGAVTNTTLQYTNSNGTAGRTGTISTYPTTLQIGTFLPFQLEAGDVGVRSIQSLTLGTSLISGTIHLVAYRVLDFCPSALAPGFNGLLSSGTEPTNNGRAALGGRDMHAAGFVRLYDNTVPFIVSVQAGTLSAYNIVGSTFQVSQG